MTKEKLDNLRNIAKFVLNDLEYTKLLVYLNTERYKRARLFIEELMEEKEIDLIVDSSNQILQTEYRNLDSIQDLIIDLIVNESDNDNGKQFRKIISQ